MVQSYIWLILQVLDQWCIARATTVKRSMHDCSFPQQLRDIVTNVAYVLPRRVPACVKTCFEAHVDTDATPAPLEVMPSGT
jgi:hypothetical protein